MLEFAHDPFQDVLDSAREFWPDLDAWIQFEPGKGDGAKGWIHFPADGSRPLVGICMTNTVSGALDILVHELAHLAAGEAEAHGPAWTIACHMLFARIRHRVEERIARDGGALVEVDMEGHELDAPG